MRGGRGARFSSPCTTSGGQAEADRFARRRWRPDGAAAVYGMPGAFTASIAWYRSGAGAVARSLAEEPPAAADRIAVPVTVLWPEHDPLFPQAWADRVEEFFSDITVRFVDGVGHFAPLEFPGALAAAVRAGVGHGGVSG